jgi:hypothetical protein
VRPAAAELTTHAALRLRANEWVELWAGLAIAPPSWPGDRNDYGLSALRKLIGVLKPLLTY